MDICTGVGNDNSLQYSCLGNSTDRGAWWATVQGVVKSLPTTAGDKSLIPGWGRFP